MPCSPCSAPGGSSSCGKGKIFTGQAARGAPESLQSLFGVQGVGLEFSLSVSSENNKALVKAAPCPRVSQLPVLSPVCPSGLSSPAQQRHHPTVTPCCCRGCPGTAPRALGWVTSAPAVRELQLQLLKVTQTPPENSPGTVPWPDRGIKSHICH